MSEQKEQQIESLALRVVQVAQNTLLMNLRFMDAAIFRLTPKQDAATLATDGRYLFYGARHVLLRYKHEPQQLVRDILHTVMHCVFRHPFVGRKIDTAVWDLAVDIAVENVILSLGVSSLAAQRDGAQQKVLNDLQSRLRNMNAEHIYRYYLEQNLSAAGLMQLRALFACDDHSIWYAPPQSQGGRNGAPETNHQNNEAQGEPDKGENNAEGSEESDADTQSAFTDESESDLKKEWEDVSRHIQMDMETFSKERGTAAGGMMQQLRELNREKYDYGAFLKKFAVMGEAMKINDDEFDYIFYTYGLKLFGNVPLIEPLEYKDVKRIREFVVAIDTSGSTSGELVQRFLEKTYNILKNSESFFSKINLHIIQCDAEIQEHVKITNQDEFDNYINGLTIKGLGGTDFRPVFREVDRMIADQEFLRLKGLIYFTDGYGEFPAQKPDYETAFVFIRTEYDDPPVPPWAIKLVLNDEELTTGTIK